MSDIIDRILHRLEKVNIHLHATKTFLKEGTDIKEMIEYCIDEIDTSMAFVDAIYKDIKLGAFNEQ